MVLPPALIAAPKVMTWTLTDELLTPRDYDVLLEW
jgi:hypothetical protein